MIRQKFNYHTHTYRCGHAVGTDEEYVQAAIKAGYEILGFSDHAPYKEYSAPTTHMEYEQLEDYINSVNMLKEKYAGQIKIVLGLETEYYDYLLDEKKELHEKVDYLLLGQHFLCPNGEGSFFRLNSDDEILSYGKTVCKALDSGLFTYLCHPDVFMNRQPVYTEVCDTVAHMIGKKLAETNTPVEINLRGIIRGLKMYGDKERYPYPHKEFWQILSSYPIRCIYGVDAHDPDELLMDDLYDKAAAELAEFDLHFITEPFI